MSVITFSPLYQERVWGGRELESTYKRALPKIDAPYGESWEMTDREGEQSVVNNGLYSGKTLNELWQNHREEVFGKDLVDTERFPLLIKILDARSDLSIQVHPPEALADKLGGEAKTEMWYVAAASPGAKLYVGLKDGVSKRDFQDAIENGTVADVVHAISPQAGESIFIPSGRLHAIGAGFLIYEIQQNSDTTYRVFDWNRMGIDGTPRQLHVEESMACIDFTDTEPSMDTPIGDTIADCEFFKVDQIEIEAGGTLRNPDLERFSIITVISGSLLCADGRNYVAGDFLLLPCGDSELTASLEASILQTTIPR
ncbi:MAG: type I phosphomannose isomerase catalytic subunit [Akkermansiaceae bacterium]